MEKISNIKIDQLRLNIPYDCIAMVDDVDSKYPKEVVLADRIFHFKWLFHNAEPGTGHNGYVNAYCFGSSDSGISIMWNESRKDMGILIDFTATGKELYQSVAQTQGLDVNWKDIIEEIYTDYDGHLSRVDIATDLINYGFSVNEIYQKLKSKKYAFLDSLTRKINVKRLKIIGTTEKAETIYIGSRKSDAFLRIYNKKLEQTRPDGLYRNIALNCNDWIRFEAEIKHRLAKQIGIFIINVEDENFYPYLLGCVLERWSLVDMEK